VTKCRKHTDAISFSLRLACSLPSRILRPVGLFLFRPARVRQVNEVTGSEPVNGEDLIESDDLKRQQSGQVHRRKKT
jgi:hypothetical protein